MPFFCASVSRRSLSVFRFRCLYLFSLLILFNRSGISLLELSSSELSSRNAFFFFLFDPVSVHSLVFLASLSVWLPIKTETVRSLLQPG